MKCIVVDNDANAIKVLEEHISKVSFLELVAVCKNGFEAVNAIKENEINLVFTEIEMPSFTGLDLVNSNSDSQISFIFTTSYTHYAIEAFNLNVLDYLVKPLTFHRFLKAIEKAQEIFKLKDCYHKFKYQQKASSFIFVKSEYENVKIDLSEIRYLESLKDYVKIYTAREKTIMTLGSLKSFEAKLDKAKFIRVHKSYIVSLKHIYSVQRNRIVIGEKRIPIGLNYKDNFLKKIES